VLGRDLAWPEGITGSLDGFGEELRSADENLVPSAQGGLDERHQRIEVAGPSRRREQESHDARDRNRSSLSISAPPIRR
jgi:hypothetical protein